MCESGSFKAFKGKLNNFFLFCLFVIVMSLSAGFLEGVSKYDHFSLQGDTRRVLLLDKASDNNSLSFCCLNNFRF